MRSVLAAVLVACLLLSGSSAQCNNSTLTPSPSARGWMSILQPPTVIPASGTYTAVVSYWTSFAGLMNVHMDLSDITAKYGFDGGAFAQITGPGAGQLTMQLPLLVSGTGATLSLTDAYQLHTYMTSAANSSCYGSSNDWQHTIFDGYNAVNVSAAPLVNSMTLLNAPTTIGASGYFVGEVAYSSNLPGWTILHMDLNDETQTYAYDGGSMLNVTSPGSGIVQLNLSISAATGLNLTDVIGIHLYMASAANYTMYSAGQTNNMDYLHAAFSQYYTATAVVPTSQVNSIVIPSPPASIPASGNFTVTVLWTTNITGLVNLHCDLSDVTASFAYDGGALVQVAGPGTGYAQLTVTITQAAAQATDKLQLHTYMLDTATSLMYQTAAGNNDWNYTLYNAYYPVGLLAAGQVCTANPSALPSNGARGWMSILQPPTVIPASGTYTAVVSYWTSFAGLMNVHMDLSDITAKYGFDGGAFAQITGPGAGQLTMQLPLLVSGTGATLSLTDAYQLHTYMTSAANSSCYGSSNDWQHTIFDGYNAVNVSAAPLVNSMTLLNAPTTIGASGYFVGEVAYSSNLPGWTILHMDLNDETQTYAYDGGSMLNVTSPGSGIVQLNLSISAATGLNLTDVIGIHLYMASAANYTMYSAGQTNNMDYLHAAFSQYYTATAVVPTSQVNSIVIPSPPASIPASGNFTVTVLWTTNITGLVNLHCDLSDVTASFAYDGGALVQVAGPGTGYAQLTVTITQAAAQATDKLQLHTYMLDTATSLMYQTAAGNNDWNYTLYNAYYPVGLLAAGQVCTANPSALPSNGARGWMSILQPPTVIPASGTYTAVVSYWTSFAGLMNVHMDLSDITAKYGFDGGAFAQITGPGAGQLTMQLPLLVSGTGATLSLTDAYQLHTYMTSAANSSCYGSSNDWQHTIFDGYNAVNVSAAPLVNSMTLLNAPTTIGASGYFVGEVAYSSNLPGWTILHMDLNDETQTYAYDGGSMLNVTSPGSGIVQLNLSISAATGLNLTDVIGIHLYMASAANYTMYSAGQTNNMDYLHAAFSQYYTATAVVPTSQVNSIVIPSPPASIPASGNFTVTVLWTTNITGLVNLHCDLSDVTASFAYDGGALVQVAGPGTGYAQLTVTITQAAAQATDKLQLHTYMLDTATSLMYQTAAGNNDWNYTLYNAYYPVGLLAAGQVCTANPSALPSNGARGWMSILQPPTVIPASGTYTAVVSYWTSFAGLMNVHMDLSDITAKYGFDGGAFAQITGPGAGQLTMQLPLLVSGTGATLSLTDAYQLHTYMTSAANSSCYGSSNDWQHTIFDGYNAVNVSAAPLVNSMTLLNAPTTIGASGYFVGEVAYSSNLPGWTILHMDLNDETQTYAYDGGSMLNVTSPGSGIVQLNLSISAATGLNLTDVIGIHLYMASAANYTMYSAGQTNNMDYLHAAFSQYYTATAVVPTSQVNSIVIPSPPASIPASGNFTVTVLWTTNITGLVNLHCDLSDVTASFAYDGGALVQVAGPGTGYAQLTVTITQAAAQATDKLQLHTYMLDTATSLMYQTAAGNNDWNYTLYNAYYPVGLLAAGQVCTANPSALPSNGARGWMSILQPPTVIPASGTYTAVVSYWTSFAGLMNVHMDLSDITAKYGFDGGAFAQITGPGAGQLTMQLPLLVSGTGATLSLTDAYQLHTYMTSAANSSCYGSSNDWQHTIFDGYNAVNVSAAPLVNSMTLLNAPTTIGASGYFVGEVAYSSNLPGWTILHMDLNDETQTYAYDGGSMLNVTSPGSGIVQLNLSISAATGLNLTDVIGIHLYMASAANYTMYSAGQTNNMDYLHAAFSQYYTATAVVPTSQVNSIVIPSPPASIPASGNFTVTVLWTTNITGLVNLHCDLSDVTASFAYDGGALVQVAGPGTGYAQLTVTITQAAAQATDKLQLHTYMLDTATSLMYQTAAGNNDWNYTLYNAYYPVTISGTGTVGTSSGGTSSGGSTTSSSSGSASGGSTISSSPSSSSLSGGAIAGIVIGSVVGVALLAVIFVWAFVARGRSSSKYQEDKMSGSHSKHEDEVSQSGHQSAGHHDEVEMEETHENAETA